MLLTTAHGMLANSDQIAYVALRKEKDDAGDPTATKLSLVLINRDAVIAADGLTEKTARLLREDLTRHWANGSAHWDATEALARIRDGGLGNAGKEER